MMKARLFGVFTALVALMMALGTSIPRAVTAQAAMSTRATILNVTTEDGVPKSVEAKAWDKAFGIAEMSMGNDGNDTILVEVSGLVPGSLYTLWWVNMKPSMTMGPATKVPDNQFNTDAQGNASITFKVPSKNDYQTLFIVYHADGKTHGEDPGKMGSESFSQLIGAFPGPAGMSPDMTMATMAPTMAGTQEAGMGSMAVSTILKATDENGVPKNIDKATWDKAIGVTSMSMGSTGTDTIVVKLGRLVPNGLYTLWWVNMKPSMSMGPAVKPPDNQFNADANGNATVTLTVPSKNDYQTLFVAFHADGKTHGTDPGKSGVETFSQLMGAFPGPAGMSPDMGMENMATMAPTQSR